MKRVVESDGLAYLGFEVGDILRRRTPREDIAYLKSQVGESV